MHPKKPSESRVTLSRLMSIQDANNLGNVHGGVIMRMVDECGALAAMRHAGGPVVTVTIDTMTFRKPIFVGYVVIINAEVTYVGRTSIETRVEVLAEHPFTGEVTNTNSAYVVYVGIDEKGHPRSVPPLEPENDIQRIRMEQAKARQEFRKKLREDEIAAFKGTDYYPTESN
jgi:uncharacterized protein (TIGR00369 family)